MAQASICTLTLNPAVDKSCSTAAVVAGPKLRCTAAVVEPGGGGINVARAILNLGGRARALWTCGGLVGQAMRRMLDASGLQHEPIQVSGETRETLHVFERSNSRLFRFLQPGPELTGQEAATCLRRLREQSPPPQYLVASGSLPPGLRNGFYADVAAAAPRGCRVVVDTSGEPLRQALAAGLFFIKPNLGELSELVGTALDDDASVERAARIALDRGRLEAVLVSLGMAGVMLVTRTQAQRFAAPVVPLVSKVGAGDSTVAGCVLALARGASIEDAVRFGIAAGSAAVMTPGTELCRRADTERLYRDMCRSGPPPS